MMQQLFITGPSPDVDIIAHRLRAKGYAVVIRPPGAVSVSTQLPLSAQERERLSEAVIEARGDRRRVPVSLTIAGHQDERVLALCAAT